MCKGLDDENRFASNWSILKCAWRHFVREFSVLHLNPMETSKIIPVFCVGNSQTIGEQNVVRAPANLKSVISIGAVNPNLVVAELSRRGNDKPDFVAPGVDIRAILAEDNSYIRQSGTSMAACFATGTIALMISTAIKCLLYLNFEEIYELLKQSSENPFSATEGYGHDLLNSLKAVQLVEERCNNIKPL